MQDNYVFGIRAIIEAIDSGKEIEKVFIKKGLTGADLFKEVFEKIRKKNIPFQYVPIEKLNKISQKNHQGVIALISSVTYQDIDSIVQGVLAKGETPFILALDGVTDVRNFGAIARTALCAGVHAIIYPEKGSAAINADAIKTSAGALHTIPVCRVKDLTTTIEDLKMQGLYLVAATEKSSVNYTEVEYKEPIVIVMGSEDKGISEKVLRYADYRAQIPMQGPIGSLNVSVAAGVLLYEVVRQRG